MMVVDAVTQQKIGDISVPYRDYREGEFAVIPVVDWAEVANSGGMSMNGTTNHIKMPITMLRRSVKIDEFAIHNRRMRGMTGSHVEIVQEMNDPMMNEILEDPNVKTEVFRDPMSMKVVFRARLMVVSANIDLSERLFDLDQFTPA